MTRHPAYWLARAAAYGAAGFVVCALLFYPLSYLFGEIFALTSGGIVARYPKELHQTLSASGGTYLSYDALPRCAIDGIISVEDKRFFWHPGIDPIAIVRVALLGLQNDHKDHGGSTLTQQLARMILRESRHQPSLLAELWSELRVVKYGLIVEHDFSKEQILELYLNSAYYGRGARGFAKAAEAYFHVDAAHLSPAQCYYLTGLPQAPSYYGNNPQAAQRRYLHVLATLRRNGYLTRMQEQKLPTPIPAARRRRTPQAPVK